MAQLPLYVKILALIGVVVVVFMLAAWEWATEWMVRGTEVLARALKSRPARKKPV